MKDTHSQIFEHLQKNIKMMRVGTVNPEVEKKLYHVQLLIESCRVGFELELDCARANAKNEILLKMLGEAYKKTHFTEEEIKLRKLLQTPVTEINIPYRVMNVLGCAKIKILGELVSCKREDVIRFRNLGSKSIDILDELLEENNLKWNMRVDYLLLNER